MKGIKKIDFTKMVASGNDFVVIDNAGTGLAPVRKLYRDDTVAVSYNAFQPLARKLCDRKYGVGADGLLFLEKSKIADVKMRIFNADGSEAEMCGNGARCAALYFSLQSIVHSPQRKIKIETKAGIIEAELKADNVKIKLTDPKDIKTDIPLRVNNRSIKVNFINTGVPHAVVFVEGLEPVPKPLVGSAVNFSACGCVARPRRSAVTTPSSSLLASAREIDPPSQRSVSGQVLEKIDVFNLGRAIRYHNEFKPAGTNVDFIEALNNNSIAIRTYERGVEDETLACGTGSVAAALIYAMHYMVNNEKSSLHPPFTKGRRGDLQVNVHTQGGEILKVYFNNDNRKLHNIWLEGKAKVVYQGIIAL